MSDFVSITIDDSQLQAALQRLEHAGVDLSPAMRKIAQALHKVTEDNFAAEGRPRWEPSERAKKEGGVTLQQTGRLAASISTDYSSRDAVIGSNVVYAAIHQFGGKIERAAYSKQVRHRTDAKGNLVRTSHFNGKGLVFAKDSHKRAQTRWFEVEAHSIDMPARPYLPITTDGKLQPEAREEVLDTILRHLKNAARG